MSSVAVALQLADRQLGLLTRRQALGAGMTEHQLRHLLKSGALVAAHAGVYRAVGSPVTFEQSCLAACFACGERAVASHRSAAALWGLRRAPDVPEVIVPFDRRREPTGVTVHRSRLMTQKDITERGVVPLTTISRTLLDLASDVDDGSLEVMIDEALRRGSTSPERLVAFVENGRFGRHPGRTALLRIAGDRVRGGVPESVLETRMMQLLRRWRLPKPARQHEVVVGGRVVRFDFAYVDEQIAIELDGRAPHWGRERWQSDHDRHNSVELGGWRVLRFTWTDVTERSEYVATTVGRVLGLRPAKWIEKDPPRRARDARKKAARGG